MRGKRAKAIRNAARVATVGAPERAYQVKTVFNGKRNMNVGIVLLHLSCTRWAYQRLKATFKKHPKTPCVERMRMIDGGAEKAPTLAAA